jgi:hypothetical protein
VIAARATRAASVAGCHIPRPGGGADQVGLKVCLVDGSDDPTPTHCQSVTSESVDG